MIFKVPSNQNHSVSVKSVPFLLLQGTTVSRSLKYRFSSQEGHVSSVHTVR